MDIFGQQVTVCYETWPEGRGGEPKLHRCLQLFSCTYIIKLRHFNVLFNIHQSSIKSSSVIWVCLICPDLYGFPPTTHIGALHDGIFFVPRFILTRERAFKNKLSLFLNVQPPRPLFIGVSLHLKINSVVVLWFPFEHSLVGSHPHGFIYRGHDETIYFLLHRWEIFFGELFEICKWVE